ncbi:hypothetical protein LCGC14_2961150, partial [marine sediment metagenome]
MTTELWNPQKDIEGFPQFTGEDARVQVQRELLKYQDEKHGGQWFIPWTKYRHPELGDGEIAGWIPKYRVNSNRTSLACGLNVLTRYDTSLPLPGLIADDSLSALNTETVRLINHYTYVLCGDGDLMEGVSAEAASLAGHHGLGKLIVFYDSNSITIEGSTDLAFTEDVLKRFAAYGWQTLSGDAYDLEGIMKLVKEAQNEENRPAII